jgi:hypothetical protein
MIHALKLSFFLMVFSLFSAGCGGSSAQESGRMTTDPPAEEVSAQSEASVCRSDADCVPDACCHPKGCTLLSEAPEGCGEVMCSAECKAGTLDCGQGACACIDGACGVRWVE